MTGNKIQALSQIRDSNSKYCYAEYGTSNDSLLSQEESQKDQEGSLFYFTQLEIIKNLSKNERKQIIRNNYLDSKEEISQIQQMFPDKQNLSKVYQDRMLKQLKKLQRRKNSKIFEIEKENEES